MGELRPHPTLERSIPRSSAATSDLQFLWLALSKERWRSLALVPVARGAEVRALGRALAELSLRFGREATSHLPAEGADPTAVSEQIAAVAQAAMRGRVLVTVSPVAESAAGLAVAQEADAVVLCVQMGEAQLASARRTLALLGGARVLGCVAIFGEQA